MFCGLEAERTRIRNKKREKKYKKRKKKKIEKNSLRPKVVSRDERDISRHVTI